MYKRQVFNNGDGSYRLYEDDGESTDYRLGKGAVTAFGLTHDVFTIYPAEGIQENLPQQRTYTVHFRSGIHGAEVFRNGAPASVKVTGNTVVLEHISPHDLVEIHLK